MSFFYRILILSALVNISLAWGNRHEHFTSWPTASSLLKAYEEVKGVSIESVKVDDLVFGAENAPDQPNRGERIYSSVFSVFTKKEQARIAANLGVDMGAEDFPEKMGRALDGKSLGAIASIASDGSRANDEYIKKFFKFVDKEAEVANKLNYLKIESLRRNLFFSMKGDKSSYKKFLERAFQETMDSIPVKNRKFIGFSVGDEFFGSELRDLKQVLEKGGTKTHFYYSLPRRWLTDINKKNDPLFQERLRVIEASLEEGWGNGVDITGSIKEQTSKKNMKAKATRVMKERLDSLYELLVGKDESVFRFHAFEGANTGDFYNEMHSFLERASMVDGKVPVFSIGHLAELNDLDIQRLKNLKNNAEKSGKSFKMVFDANLVSNMFLQDKELESLISTMKKLDEAGFEVALGSDGTGILGRKSSDGDQARAIAAALKKKGKSDSEIFSEIKKLLKATRAAPMCNVMALEQDLLRAVN